MATLLMNASVRQLELVGAVARYPMLRELAASNISIQELNRRFGLDLVERERHAVVRLSDVEIEEYLYAEGKRFEEVIPYGV